MIFKITESNGLFIEACIGKEDHLARIYNDNTLTIEKEGRITIIYDYRQIKKLIEAFENRT